MGILLVGRETGADYSIGRYCRDRNRLWKSRAAGAGRRAAPTRSRLRCARSTKRFRRISADPGGHLLTGPVAIEGAEPGDVLEVRIREIRMDVPFAYNTFRKGAGFLPDEFEGTKTKIIPLDRARNIGTFAPGIEIPLKPFFGSMGVAPPEAAGKVNSASAGYSRRQSGQQGTSRRNHSVHSRARARRVVRGRRRPRGHGKRRSGHHRHGNLAHRRVPVHPA